MIKLVLFYYVFFLVIYALYNFERVEKSQFQGKSQTGLFDLVFLETELLCSDITGWDCKKIFEFSIARNNSFDCFEEVRLMSYRKIK